MSIAKKRIGELLVDAGVVTESIINKALQEKRTDQKIGDYLVGKGYVTEDILYQKLSEQLKTPLFCLNEVRFKSEVIDVVSKDLLNKHIAFPIELSGSLLTIAMADPLDEVAIKEIEESINLDVSAVLAKKSEILDYVSKFYDIDDSIQELFNIYDEELEDRNELPVIDLLTTITKNKKKINLIFVATKEKVDLIKGEFGNSSIKEFKYLLEFLKKATGYIKNKNSMDNKVIIRTDTNSRILISLTVIKKGNYSEFWVEVEYVEDKIVKSNSKLNSITESGIYLLLNPSFKKTNEIHESLVGLNEKFKDDVLIYSDNIDFEGLGLTTLNNNFENISELSGFAKVFYFDNGWETSNFNEVIKLLHKNKIVILHVPFNSAEEAKEYFKKSMVVGESLVGLIKDVITV